MNKINKHIQQSMCIYIYNGTTTIKQIYIYIYNKYNKYKTTNYMNQHIIITQIKNNYNKQNTYTQTR